MYCFIIKFFFTFLNFIFYNFEISFHGLRALYMSFFCLVTSGHILLFTSNYINNPILSKSHFHPLLYFISQITVESHTGHNKILFNKYDLLSSSSINYLNFLWITCSSSISYLFISKCANIIPKRQTKQNKQKSQKLKFQQYFCLSREPPKGNKIFEKSLARSTYHYQPKYSSANTYRANPPPFLSILGKS